MRFFPVTALALIVSATTVAGCSGSSEPPPPSSGGTAGAAGSGTGGSAGSGTGGASGSAGSSTGGTGGGTGGTGGGTGGTGGGTGGTGGGTGGAGGAAGAAGAGGTGGGAPLCPPDADGDTIPDDLEGAASDRNTDGADQPDYLDTDSDNDGIPDSVERGDPVLLGCALLPEDTDGDGESSPYDVDSDDNGILDEDEGYTAGAQLVDTDGDGQPDLWDVDDDDDALWDSDELVNGAPANSDADTIPDHKDIDSDGDTIADEFETFADFDRDGTPNIRDLDSDADTITDACEAGFLHQVSQPPANSDADGQYDAYDRDSDNDGIKDGLEDLNKNCIVDVGETDRAAADTDGDGVGDMIESATGSDPANAAITPATLGNYYFILPHNQTPIPPVQDVVLRTNFNKGDIAFIVDSTGTMAGAISNVRNNLSTIVTQIKAEVPDARFGVLTAEEFPVAPYGGASNLPVRLPGDTMAYLDTNTANINTALTQLLLTDGGDAPEAQLVSMYRAMNNTLLTWPGGGQLGPYSPTGGVWGGLGFRDDALPVFVMVTDAPFHNGRRVGDSVLHDPYSFTAPTVDDVISSMRTRGAKFVGVSLDDGGTARTQKDPYRDMATLTDATGSLVLPMDAFNSPQCLTDLAGSPAAPDAPYDPNKPPRCRLIFSAYKTGVGTSTSVVDGVKALLRGVKIEVRVIAVTVRPPSLVCGTSYIDAVDDFIESVEVNVSGGVPDPADPNYLCETLDPQNVRDWYEGPRGVIGGPPPIDQPDAINDTAVDVTPGTRICFKIRPRINTLCPQTEDAQTVRASLLVRARNEGQAQELEVGTPRDVFFVIPPTFQ